MLFYKMNHPYGIHTLNKRTCFYKMGHPYWIHLRISACDFYKMGRLDGPFCRNRVTRKTKNNPVGMGHFVETVSTRKPKTIP